MVKISIIGAGNAGSNTALHYAWHTRKEKDVEIELIYNPDIPPERIGQATLLESPDLLWSSVGFDWYNNYIHATPKTGILYEGWGKVNDKVFHDFPADRTAMHYCPWEMQDLILKSGLFKVIEDEVDPRDVDADYVFDCRGKPKDFSDYEELINPTNACILGKPNWNTTEALWSRHVATPDGWTFIIPTPEDSPSHDYCVGYCYNSNITKKEVAEYNFLEMFDVDITKCIDYKNYVAKNPIIDDRIILNGNRLFFLEPMESSSTQAYLEWSRYTYDFIFSRRDATSVVGSIKRYIQQLEHFVAWHYFFGSKYDTPFWKYVEELDFEDREFEDFLHLVRMMDWGDLRGKERHALTKYAQWIPYSFRVWYDGMTSSLTERTVVL